MSPMARRNTGWFLVIILLAALLGYLLYWRFLVGSTRFFDVDEFTYLHWAARSSRGELPYVDFFTWFTPGFMWVFAPLFWVYGISTQVFVAARIVSYGIFLGLLGALGVLFRQTRGSRWVMLALVLFAFLPLPFEKLLEVRPDNLATLFAVIGVIWQIRAIREGKKATFHWLTSGLAYSASLFVLVKTLPFVIVGAGVAWLALWKDTKKLLVFFGGLFVPWVLYFGAQVITGHFPVVWYSLTRLPLEAARGAVSFPMEANLFFWPNWWLYGGDGVHVNLPLIANHAIWLLAIFVGAYRLVTAGGGDREHRLVEILVAGTFFLSIAAYAKFFPLKHSQYLIPISVFVAYYAADGISMFLDWLARARFELVMLALIGVSYLFIVVTQDINKGKLYRTLYEQTDELQRMIDTIPKTARVVDLEGRMLFWPEGYPICCLPFDIFLPYVTRGPLPLAAYLSRTPADYIFDGETQRIATMLPDNVAYIHRYFAPVPGWGNRLWKRK